MRLTLRGGFVGVLLAGVVQAGTPLTAEELRAREFTAALADVTAKRERACRRLDEAANYFWGTKDPLEWPRKFRKKLPGQPSEFRAAADACADEALAADEKADWSVSSLLSSALLQDDARRKRAIERNGGPPSRGRGGGTGDYGGTIPEKHDCIDPATAQASSSGLDAELVTSAIRRGRGAVRYCYESQLSRVQGHSGKVLVRFEITSEGKTSKIVMDESTLNDALVEACVLERIESWVFPRPKKGTAMVSYPFEFGPAAE